MENKDRLFTALHDAILNYGFEVGVYNSVTEVTDYHKEIIDEDDINDYDKMLYAFHEAVVILSPNCFVQVGLKVRIPQVYHDEFEGIQEENVIVYTGFISSVEEFDDILVKTGIHDIIIESKIDEFGIWAVRLGLFVGKEPVKPISVKDYLVGLEVRKIHKYLKTGSEVIRESNLSEDEKKMLIGAATYLSKYITAKTMYAIMDDIDDMISEDDEEDDDEFDIEKHICHCEDGEECTCGCGHHH